MSLADRSFDSDGNCVALRFAYVMCSSELKCRETAYKLERTQEFAAVILHPHDQKLPTIWRLPSRCLLTLIWPSPVSQSISAGRYRDSFGTYVRTEGVKKKHLSGSPGCQWSNKTYPGASILPIIKLQKFCARRTFAMCRNLLCQPVVWMYEGPSPHHNLDKCSTPRWPPSPHGHPASRRQPSREWCGPAPSLPETHLASTTALHHRSKKKIFAISQRNGLLIPRAQVCFVPGCKCLWAFRAVKFNILFNSGNGLSPWLDLPFFHRFAPGILWFRESARAIGGMLDAVVACLEQAGLKLNASKTLLVTTLTQPPSTLTPHFFFPRAFLTAERSVARTVLLVSLQALGTMLAIYIPAAPGCAEERAKSKPASLQKGWKSAVIGGGWWLQRGSHWWKGYCRRGCGLRIQDWNWKL